MITKIPDKARALNVIYDFKQFQKWCGPSSITPNTSELEKYLSTDLQMFNNGQIVVRGVPNYLDRLQKCQKNIPII